MSTAKIVGVSKALPAYCRTTEEIVPFVNLWLSEQDERYRRKVVKIFEGAGVDKRFPWSHNPMLGGRSSRQRCLPRPPPTEPKAGRRRQGGAPRVVLALARGAGQEARDHSVGIPANLVPRTDAHRRPSAPLPGEAPPAAVVVPHPACAHPAALEGSPPGVAGGQ